MASSAVPIFAVANLLVALLYILMMTSAGVLINYEQLPAFVRFQSSRLYVYFFFLLNM